MIRIVWFCKGVYLACRTDGNEDKNKLFILLFLLSLASMEVDWDCLALYRSWFAKLEKSFQISYQFISTGVEIKDGPFASNNFWGDVKFRQDRFIAFWSGPLSLAKAILCLLLIVTLIFFTFFFLFY